MSFRWFLRKSCVPGFSFVSLPSFRRAGCLWRVSGCLFVLPEGFPPLPLDLVQREGWGSLWSRVQCAWARFCLLGSFGDWGDWSCSRAANSCYFFCPIGSPSSSLYVWRGDGVGEWFGVLGYVLGCLSRLISARSAKWWGGWDFRVPLLLVFLWPANLRLERQGGSLSALLVEWLLLAVLLLTLTLRLPFSVKRSRRCERGSSR